MHYIITSEFNPNFPLCWAVMTHLFVPIKEAARESYLPLLNLMQGLPGVGRQVVLPLFTKIAQFAEPAGLPGMYKMVCAV